MENIVIKTLEEKISNLYALQNTLGGEFYNEYMPLLKEKLCSIDKRFENITRIDFNSDKIFIELFKDSWNKIEIRRSISDWENMTYGPAILDGVGSRSNITREIIDFYSLFSIIGNLYLCNSPEWDDLCLYMDWFHEFKKSKINPISKEISLLESKVREEKNKIQFDLEKSVFDRGEMNLVKTTKFYFGHGKYDYHMFKDIKWEINKGGKTTTIYLDGRQNYESNNLKIKHIKDIIRQNINNII